MISCIRVRFPLLVFSLAFAGHSRGQSDLVNPAHAPSPLPVGSAAPSPASSVTLQVNLRQLSHNNEAVEVSFTGVANPTNYDAVGLFFDGAGPDQRHPLKYKWARTSPGYLSTGSGSLNFILLNQREPVVFYFFHNATSDNGFSNLSYVGRSPALTLANPNEPLQGHLALTADPTQVVVQWTTRDPGHPTVKYGAATGQLTATATGSTHTYSAADFCGSPANDSGYVAPGSLHIVTLDKLAPSSQYFYVFGDPSFGFSKEFSFYTGPAVGAASTVHFLATADLGHTTLDASIEYDYDESEDPLNYSPTGTITQAFQTLTQIINDNEYQQGASRGTVEAMAADNTQNWTLYLLDGDVSYARGEQTMWDDFMDQMEQLAGRIPWMLTNGNHEMDWPTGGDRYAVNGNIDSGGECGVPYHQRFALPYNSSGNWTDAFGRVHLPAWYSFDHGPVHMLMYSTEFDFNPGSPQYQFIIDDLSNVNRNITPWVAVNGHRPIYTTSSSGGSYSSVTSVARDLRDALEDVFFQYEVDLTWHGHDHIYERTCPVYKSICQAGNADGTQSAPIHIVIGNSGYELSWFANPIVPSYWDVIYLEHGYQRCSVNATSFACEALSSVTGKVLDSWRLTKPPGWQPMGTKARKAFTQSFNTIYNTDNVIEVYGLANANYSIVEEPTYAALMGANASLVEQIADTSAALLAVNGATPGGTADTMPDVWAVLEPFYTLLQEYSATNASVAAAARPGLLPMLQQVERVANAWSTGNGQWHISDRALQGLAPTVSATSPKASPASLVAGR